LFLEKIIPKDKKLFLGIKSGVNGSEIELFWGGFTAINLNSILKIEGFFSSILVDLFSMY